MVALIETGTLFTDWPTTVDRPSAPNQPPEGSPNEIVCFVVAVEDDEEEGDSDDDDLGTDTEEPGLQEFDDFDENDFDDDFDDDFEQQLDEDFGELEGDSDDDEALDEDGGKEEFDEDDF